MKNQKNTSLKVEYISVSDIKPALYNPRKHSIEALEQLKTSIKKFGVADPLIVNGAVNRKNILIGGHMRLKAVKELGYTKMPVVYLNIPDEKKEAELNLRLNRNVGEWNWELLKEFDINLLLDVGFDDKDLSNIWDSALETEDDNFDIEKEIQKIKVPETKLGDFYQLGQHRLLCGDSTDLKTVKQLIGEEKIAMIYSDPPYNINLSYNNGIGAKGKYGGKTNDNKTDKEYKEFLKQTIVNALEVSKQDCHVFYWADEKYIGLIQELYRELNLDNRRVCLWIKNNGSPTPQIAFSKAYEPCVYATRGNPYLASSVTNLNEVLNKEIGTGNRMLDDIMDSFNIWLVKRLPAMEYEHPTEKPPTLHEKALRRCTKHGDIILDLFGGSGSTLVSCEQLKRRAFLIEIEPIFCDLIIKRYEALTGLKVKLIN